MWEGARGWLKTSQLETKIHEGFKTLQGRCAWLMQERREETGESGWETEGGWQADEITAATSAIINETQIVGEGSNVAVIGTRWWALRSHSTWSPGMKVAAFLIIDLTEVAPPDRAWITTIFTAIVKNLLAMLHGRCVFLFLCLCGFSPASPPSSRSPKIHIRNMGIG